MKPETVNPHESDFDDSIYSDVNKKRTEYKENLKKQLNKDVGPENKQQPGLDHKELGEAIRRAKAGEHIADVIKELQNKKAAQ